MKQKYDVFISYSRANLEKVKSIKAEIERSTGVRCWMDLEGIESGVPRFTRSIIEGIKQCQIFLFMCSAQSQSSEFALRELNFADKRCPHIVIVHIDAFQMNEEFEFLYGLTDAIDWNNLPQREKLYRDIKKWISGYREDFNEECELEDEREKELADIEFELSTLKSQRISYNKNVLQKEQELKQAQLDLKSCEAKIQKLQTRLDEIRTPRTKGKNGITDIKERSNLKSASNMDIYNNTSTQKKESNYKVVLRSVGPNRNQVKKCIQEKTLINEERADYIVSKTPIDLIGSYSLGEANQIKLELISLGAMAAVREHGT